VTVVIVITVVMKVVSRMVMVVALGFIAATNTTIAA
jgi:hypothetical protein